MIVVHRTALRRRAISLAGLHSHSKFRNFHTGALSRQKDPRVSNLGNVIEDRFAVVRDQYQTPKNPIVLAHGLLGFNELHPAGNILPGIQYWHGITDALGAKGVEVITAEVPPSGRIEARAEKLAATINAKLGGKDVNIIAGLDSRHMVSRLRPHGFQVLSLTTIATPHRGSAFADYIFDQIGPASIPKVYKILEFFGLESGAFRQLTQDYMAQKFNPRTPDVEGVKYYSYGAKMQPHFLSVFRQSHDIVEKVEGPNDGLVSVASSQWGTYKGTLNNVSHLDLINWTNKLRWYFWQLGGYKKDFNAIAFYLDIADMLAKEGL